MKLVLVFISCLTVGIGFCQYPIKQGLGNKSNTIIETNAIKVRDGFVNATFPDTVSANLTEIKNYPYSQIAVGNIILIRDSTATKWLRFGTYVKGTAISSLPEIGFVPNTNDILSWIDSVFYRSQPPTISLAGGTNLEYRGAGVTDVSVTYTAGRQFATYPLSSIRISGVSLSLTQPDTGKSVSGTQSISIINNVDTTITANVTTIDDKSAVASTTFKFLPKRYWGWISDTAGIGGTGFNDTIITSLNNEISASKVKSFSTGNPTGTQFLVYAYYSSAGDLSHFDMNGFPSIEAMNHVTRTFTNTLGYTGQWTIYWSKNGQTLQSTVVAN